MTIKERVKQGVITLEQASAEIAEGNRGLKRSKSARWVEKQVKPKPKKVRKKVSVQVDAPILQQLTLKECMQARTEFEADTLVKGTLAYKMSAKAAATTIQHMNGWIQSLKGKLTNH